MNRRTALFSTLMFGGLIGRFARGQERRTPAFRPSGANVDEPALDPDLGLGTDPFAAEPLQSPSASQSAPLGGPNQEDIAFTPPPQIKQKGLGWGIFNISSYTSLPHSRDTAKPESAFIEWIFRHTGSAIWHGEDSRRAQRDAE